MGSRHRPGSNRPWRHWDTRRGELPKCREKLANQDREEPMESGGRASGRGRRPGEIPQGQGCRRGCRPATEGTMWGLQRTERAGGEEDRVLSCRATGVPTWEGAGATVSSAARERCRGLDGKSAKSQPGCSPGTWEWKGARGQDHSKFHMGPADGPRLGESLSRVQLRPDEELRVRFLA